MRAIFLCLPLFVACVAPAVEDESLGTLGVAEGLPFRVAVLPVAVAEGETFESSRIRGGAEALAAGFGSGLFVQAEPAASLSSALHSEAELIVVCEAFGAAASSTGQDFGSLNLRFYDSSFPEAWSGAYPAGTAGLTLSIVAPLVEGDWAATTEALVEQIRSSSGGLLDSGLAPFRLETSELKFQRSGARFLMTGTVRFAETSRSRHLRSIWCTLPSGERVECEFLAPAPNSSEESFTAELPELESGELLILEVEVGSRVRYRRRYAVRLL